MIKERKISVAREYGDMTPLKAGVVITQRSRHQKSMEILQSSFSEDFLVPWMPEA